MVASPILSPLPSSQTVGPPVRLRAPRERGTAIFVVVLVVTTLTAIGIFAARMTSAVDAATGYARQSVQAQGVSIYAGQLAANVLLNEAARIKNTMESAAAAPSSSSATSVGCPSNRGQANAYCAFRAHAELSALSSQPLLAAQTKTAPGSLGPKHGLSTVAGVEGTLHLEFLDVARGVPRPGASMGSSTQTTEVPYEFGLNSWAILRPTMTATSQNVCVSDAASTTSNLQSTRLYITVPRL